MELKDKIKNRSAKIGIIGLGYVGLPLGLEFATKGFNVVGFDLDKNKIDSLGQGKSYIKHIAGKRVKDVLASNKLSATSDFKRLNELPG